MKLFKKIRKGFTLIELVVVIAVIAILSAVAVVSYISITNKAKRSSDEQAVAQMNTILKANEILELNSIKDVFAAFNESGLDAKNYKPLSKDTYFFWDADLNRVLYVDSSYKVIYPNEYKGQTKSENSHWLSLSSEIAQRDYSSDKTAAGVTVTGSATEAGEKLYKLSEDIESGAYSVNTAEAQEIVLPEKVDLAGSEFCLGTAQNLTIKGESTDKKTVVDNVFSSEYQSLGTSANRTTRKYSAGMIQEVKGDVTFENLEIRNVTIGDYNTSMTAIFAGRVSKGKLTIKNCVIDGAYIYGEQKVAAIAGYLEKEGSIELINVTFKNVHIMAEEGCAGGVVGLKSEANELVVDAASAKSIKENTTVSLTKVADRHYYNAPKELTDASNEVASTFNSYVDRTPETIKINNVSYERCKPGCATFGWINKTAEAFGTYGVAYGLNPIHF